ncbi:hypothetical protein B0H13DRAFT_1898704 [Mycena leptocephala]|nr:hypothetical protein B0H13DRAFT_1898704 [Mycena leptocephala]
MKAIALSILCWQFRNASAESAHPMRVGVKRTFDGIITLNGHTYLYPIPVFYLTKFKNQKWSYLGVFPWAGGTGPQSRGSASDVYPDTVFLPLVKMVGIFVNALVGLYIIEDLLENFGDLKMSITIPSKPIAFLDTK